MKFFYALMLFLVSSMLFFGVYIFFIPTPKLYIAGDNTIAENVDETNVVVRQALEISKLENKGNYYFFDLNLSEKRPNALLLYVLLTIVLLLTIFLIFHTKTYLFFPLTASIILSLFLCSILWIFTNSFSKDIYLDLQNIRYVKNSLEYIRSLGLFLFIEIILLTFGYWYRFPEE